MLLFNLENTGIAFRAENITSVCVCGGGELNQSIARKFSHFQIFLVIRDLNCAKLAFICSGEKND